MTLDLRQLALDALSVANQYADAGITEVGDNGGDQVGWFQHSTGGSAGDSWCADFVYACFLKTYCNRLGFPAGADSHGQRVFMLNHADEMTARTKIARTGYCPTVAQSAKVAGRFHNSAFTPSPGDLVLFDFHGQGEPHHVAFVRGLDGANVLTTEGNTSSGVAGSQADGDGVYKRERPRTHVYGFVHFEGLV